MVLFQYAILLTIVVAVFMKYILHTIDLQSVNPWENKAVYILYSELVMGEISILCFNCFTLKFVNLNHVSNFSIFNVGFIKSLLYITFMVIMIRVHTFPLFAIRPMYLTLR